MATSAFKSTSRRGAATDSKAPPPTAAASRRRSHSVSAVSRKTHLPIDDGNSSISTGFSNSRDNPLFWSTSSPPDKEESGKKGEIATTSNNKPSNSSNARNGNGSRDSGSEQRGRSVTRRVSGSNGIGRSLSRIRGRSVSTAPYTGAYESEKEQDVVVSTIAQSRNESKRTGNSISRSSSVRTRVDKVGHAKNSGVRLPRKQATEWSEDDSACSLQISNLEDGISIGSLSEAEEKTIIAAFEELSTFRRNNVNTVTATNVADMPEAELITDVGREYAIKLEESEERARKLRADLAIEEQRGQELDRILKEILCDSETSSMQRPRRGRRTSNERKRMSRRLTDEAMTYFDECVSLSTFDSSDFSASEDPSYSSIGATRPTGASSLVKGTPTSNCYDHSSYLDQQQVQLLNGCEDSESAQLYKFSFADKRSQMGPEEDIRNYIKNFERNTTKDVVLEAQSSYYDAGEYSSIQGYTESMLIERVVHKSKIESGGLLLCGGAISCSSFASVV